MAITQFPSLLFTPGRACAGPLAVVLHGFSSGIEVLDLEMDRCPRPRPLCSPGCHTSFHYGVDGCVIHQYVATADTAWGFGLTAPTCPPPVCPPDPCASCTGLTADQYNPVLSTGLPPVIPVFGADAQCPGTANCGVIHVAIPGQSGFSALDPFGQCCFFFGGDPLDPDFDPTTNKVYNCLVKSLCEIFDAAGLVPTVNNLLIHCNELLCLDTARLVEDILLCLNAPVPPIPPCICAPTAVQLCQTLGTVLLGAPSAGPFLGQDCLFHASLVDVTVTALDTATINTTAVEAPTNTFTLSSDVIISPDTGNTLEARVNGLFADRGTLSVVPILNAGTIDPTSGNDVFVYSSVGAGAVTLVNPIAGEKVDFWVKNISASVLTITAASLIDGVGVITLDGTIPAGYPFGNNGGEAVHLVFDTANVTWYVL